MNVVRFPVPKALPDPEPMNRPLLAYQLARLAMLKAFDVWLRTKPNPLDVAMEIEGSRSIIDQLAILNDMNREDHV